MLPNKAENQQIDVAIKWSFLQTKNRIKLKIETTTLGKTCVLRITNCNIFHNSMKQKIL